VVQFNDMGIPLLLQVEIDDRKKGVQGIMKHQVMEIIFQLQIAGLRVLFLEIVMLISAEDMDLELKEFEDENLLMNQAEDMIHSLMEEDRAVNLI
jgi:hypothetical protein